MKNIYRSVIHEPMKLYMTLNVCVRNDSSPGAVFFSRSEKSFEWKKASISLRFSIITLSRASGMLVIFALRCM